LSGWQSKLVNTKEIKLPVCKTLSHKQKKHIEWGGDWCFEELCILCPVYFSGGFCVEMSVVYL